MQSIINFLLANQAMIYAVLFAISEAMALVPGVQSNGIFQMIFNFLKSKQPPAA